VKRAWVALLAALLTACAADDGQPATPPSSDAGAPIEADAGALAVEEPKAGPALETTHPPVSVPPPARMVSFKTKRNRPSALVTDVACSAADEGRGDCAVAAIVWCDDGKMVALDCSSFTGDDRNKGFCGEVPDTEGQIGCLLTTAR
jgi:hypothetical protein